MKPHDRTLPAHALSWLHELGWPRRGRSEVDVAGTPVLVWLVTRACADDTEPQKVDPDAVMPLIDELLAVLAHPRQVDGLGRTPLHLAATHARIIERLLAAGALVDARDGAGLTPLHNALRACNEAGADLLLKAGADVHVATETFDALLAAVVRDSSRGVIQLLDAGLDPNRPGEKQKTCLMHLNHQLDPPVILDALMAAGADASLRAIDGSSALIHALMCHAAPAIVECLLAARAPVDQEKPEHLAPLVAAALRHPALLARLLAAGADPQEAWALDPTCVLDAPTALARNWLLSAPDESTHPGKPSIDVLDGLLRHLLAAGAAVERLEAYLTEQSAFTDEAAHLEGAIARAGRALRRAVGGADCTRPPREAVDGKKSQAGSMADGCVLP